MDIKNIEIIRNEINNFSLKDKDTLEAFKSKYLAKKGLIQTLFKNIKDIEPGERKEYGQLVNDLKQLAEEKYQNKVSVIENAALNDKSELPDITLDAIPLNIGALHPLTIIRNEMVSIFRRMGFSVSEGPEIEDDWHNFTALNTPEDHPARDMQDTFYVQTNPEMVLRTQTSSVQVHLMEEGKLPVKTISPGRVYRNEAVSARAHCIFHQVEGLYIDESVSFADLKQCLFLYAGEMFGAGIKVRFRPSYFPFTEPSAEMDITCLICKGKGCPVCKKSGWVEILGCGMVDPDVLKNCKIDPEKYTGYAFGIGIERIAMLKYQISDIRLFYENDVRFLKQFIG